MVLQRKTPGRQGANRRVQHTPGICGAGDCQHGALQPRQQHEYSARQLAAQSTPTSQQHQQGATAAAAGSASAAATRFVQSGQLHPAEEDCHILSSWHKEP